MNSSSLLAALSKAINCLVIISPLLCVSYLVCRFVWLFYMSSEYLRISVYFSRFLSCQSQMHSSQTVIYILCVMIYQWMVSVSLICYGANFTSFCCICGVYSAYIEVYLLSGKIHLINNFVCKSEYNGSSTCLQFHLNTIVTNE